jgi:hypothetical protein
LEDEMMSDKALSPRADKLKFWTSRPHAIAYAVVVIAAAILPAVPARGSDAPAPVMMVKRAAALPLPGIPYLETTPWLSWEPYRQGLKVDTLQLPRLWFNGEVDDDFCRQRPLGLPIS